MLPPSTSAAREADPPVGLGESDAASAVTTYPHVSARPGENLHPFRAMRQRSGGVRLDLRPVRLPARESAYSLGGQAMWWGIGFGGLFLYLVLVFTLGLMTLRNGHGWMFFLGIFFPILWIFGAFMRPPEMTQPV
jgi:hypothetical protein